MKVRDVYKKFSDRADTVNLDTPIEKVIDMFSFLKVKDRLKKEVYQIFFRGALYT